MKRIRSRGQASIENAVLLIAAVAAMVAMFAFIRSAMSYRYKTGADGIGHGRLYKGS